MQLRELSKPITAKTLNESLAKKFGYKINLEQFTMEQLSDVQNKLRTKMSQFELGESFDSVNESPAYQKTRLMLDCVNQAILEREEEKEKCCCEEKGQAKCPVHCDDEPKHKSKKNEARQIKEAKKAEMRKKLQADKMKEKAMEHSVPESWINSALNRIELGESDEQELVAELTTRYDLSENIASHIVYLAEGEEEKAEAIMATKDMIDRITGWYDDIAQMKAEQLLELLDSIGENFGSDVQQKYEQAIKPALESVSQSLEQARRGLNQGFALVSGKQADTMGADTSEMPPMPGGDAGAPDMGTGEMPPMPGGEEGAPEAGPMPGGEEGRMKRESVEYSRKLALLLASKKK
jgi:hypothetical protein